MAPVDWVRDIETVVTAGAAWVLDMGPGDQLTRLTASVVRGTGVGVVPGATRDGQRNLLTPGAAPEIAPAWREFAPQPVELPDGRVVVETAFTRLTGRSPILLAGMTPTTVDPAIVAASPPTSPPDSPRGPRGRGAAVSADRSCARAPIR